ncbi:MAG TPA: 5-carboxymethyl-2-hydroxymuconate Delta-isomerase [Allosphingosinicella sp.]
MPQITIEYSANLDGRFDARGFASKLHGHLVAHADAQIESCKTRLVRLDEVVIGAGEPHGAMIHADVRILTGRSDQQKRLLGEAAIQSLEDAVSGAEGLEVQLTVEVRELDRANYHKRVLSV